MYEIQQYRPLSVVTIEGGEQLFILRDAANELAAAVNDTKNHLVPIGDRWVTRFSVKAIEPWEPEAGTAESVLVTCPKLYREKLRSLIEKNKESSGKMPSDYWANTWLAQWQKEDAEKNAK